jgi:hypothetical protein
MNVFVGIYGMNYAQHERGVLTKQRDIPKETKYQTHESTVMVALI